MKPTKHELKAEPRDLGKKNSDTLRDEKRVPAVLYGPRVEENLHFSVAEIDLEKILSIPQTKLQKLELDGKEYDTLLKRVEFHPVTDRPVHADFYKLEDDIALSLNIPVVLVGTAKGVRESGGRVFQPVRRIMVRVLPENIPVQFEIDITALGVNQSLSVGDLDAEGIEILDDPSRTIVTIAPPKSGSAFSSAEDEEELVGAEEGEASEETADAAEAAE